MSNEVQLLSNQPWFIEPTFYDFLIYPCEWMVESSVEDHKMRAHSNVFHTRNWGRTKVMTLQTLFYADSLAADIGEDILTSYIDLIKNKSDIKLFPSDGLALLQGGRLKELAKEHRRQLTGYWASPLIPSVLDPFAVFKINLGLPYSADKALAEIKTLEKAYYE